ncbi:MAG: FKBP-type peptidyl-prolyl cis-trans isomerase N-terminal domain-containing protein, partial [Methylococcaceae bacterium]
MKKIIARTTLLLGMALPLSMAFTQCTSRTTEEINLNKNKNREFLVENGKRAEITTRASGLQYQIINEGTGTKPTGTDFVTVNYTGSLITGQIFDQGENIGFPLN